MDTICLTCGDKGFSNALVFCLICLEVAVHRYCLYKVTYDEFVYWVCEDCKDKVPKEVSIRNSDAVPPENFTDYDPVWRREFNIWNKKYSLYGGFVAHLSVKASQRVSEAAKLFPLYLHFEMLPKADLWPKRFKMSEPSDDDIALYFVPSEARYEQDFDHLVNDMISGELALRAFMPNADLLVFTSTELPLRRWRFQQKHYLCGVLRAKQNPSSRQMVSNGIDSVMRQTPGNILAARDPTNLVKGKTRHNEGPISPLSNSEDNLADSMELGRGKRVRIPSRRLTDFVDLPEEEI